jgi:hypothetical protein
VFHSIDPSILQLKVKQSEPRAFHANLEELLSVATIKTPALKKDTLVVLMGVKSGQ